MAVDNSVRSSTIMSARATMLPSRRPVIARQSRVHQNAYDRRTAQRTVTMCHFPVPREAVHIATSRGQRDGRRQRCETPTPAHQFPPRLPGSSLVFVGFWQPVVTASARSPTIGHLQQLGQRCDDTIGHYVSISGKPFAFTIKPDGKNTKPLRCHNLPF